MPKETVYGYEVREPYESEMEFFKKHPETPAYAAEDNSIVVSPYADLTPEQRNGLLMNEASRLYMRENKIIPDFDITPEQQDSFANTPYSDNLDAMRQTIVGRILSNDRSAGQFTPSQQRYTNWIYDQLRRRK